MKEKIHKTTFLDRVKNAVRAFRGKPCGSIQYGLTITRCDDCEFKNADQSEWKYELITWLRSEKYISIDEFSCNMTEEEERAFKWELSRNHFINKVIKHIEEME